ncbi:MAG TPA: hypothetical protein VKU42_11225 [Candidatus Angelobacter sp.]|nr:hypothetical protein [Candidatus Angelobacter sp.]
MPRILLVGYIPELLREPEHTLRNAGYDVIVALSYAAASRAIASGPVDVAAFGFSVPESDRNQLARIVKDAWPSVQIIMIYFASVKNTELADALMPNTSTPQEILRAVNHMLTKNQSRRA